MEFRRGGCDGGNICSDQLPCQCDGEQFDGERLPPADGKRGRPKHLCCGWIFCGGFKCGEDGWALLANQYSGPLGLFHIIRLGCLSFSPSKFRAFVGPVGLQHRWSKFYVAGPRGKQYHELFGKIRHTVVRSCTAKCNGENLVSPIRMGWRSTQHGMGCLWTKRGRSDFFRNGRNGGSGASRCFIQSVREPKHTGKQSARIGGFGVAFGKWHVGLEPDASLFGGGELDGRSFFVYAGIGRQWQDV